MIVGSFRGGASLHFGEQVGFAFVGDLFDEIAIMDDDELAGLAIGRARGQHALVDELGPRGPRSSESNDGS